MKQLLNILSIAFCFLLIGNIQSQTITSTIISPVSTTTPSNACVDLIEVQINIAGASPSDCFAIEFLDGMEYVSENSPSSIAVNYLVMDNTLQFSASANGSFTFIVETNCDLFGTDPGVSIQFTTTDCAMSTTYDVSDPVLIHRPIVLFNTTNNSLDNQFVLPESNGLIREYEIRCTYGAVDELQVTVVPETEIQITHLQICSQYAQLPIMSYTSPFVISESDFQILFPDGAMDDTEFITVKETFNVVDCAVSANDCNQTTYESIIGCKGSFNCISNNFSMCVIPWYFNSSLGFQLQFDEMPHGAQTAGILDVCGVGSTDMNHVISNPAMTNPDLPAGAGAKHMVVYSITIDEDLWSWSEIGLGHASSPNYVPLTLGNNTTFHHVLNLGNNVNRYYFQFENLTSTDGDFDGAGPLSDINGDGIFDELPEGQQLVFTFKDLQFNCHEKLQDCGSENFILTRFSPNPGQAPCVFRSYCENNTTQWFDYSIVANGTNGDFFSEADITDITPDDPIVTISYDYTPLSNRSPWSLRQWPWTGVELFDCSNMEYRAVVHLPDGFVITQTTVDCIDNVTAMNVTCNITGPTPNPDGGMDYLIEDIPYNTNFDLPIELVCTAQGCCPGTVGYPGTCFGFNDIVMELQAVCDPTCDDCYRTYGCVSNTVYKHCNGFCHGGFPMSTESFEFNRSTFGWQEANPSIPIDPDVDPVIFNRVYNTDHIEAILKGSNSHGIVNWTDPDCGLSGTTDFSNVSSSFIGAEFVFHDHPLTNQSLFDLDLDPTKSYFDICPTADYDEVTCSCASSHPTIPVESITETMGADGWVIEVKMANGLYNGVPAYDNFFGENVHVTFVGDFITDAGTMQGGPTDLLAPDFYQMQQIRGQFIHRDLGNVYTPSCDSWGDNMTYLDLKSRLTHKEFRSPSTGSYDYWCIWATNQCQSQFVLWTDLIGGFDQQDDFPLEYRPVNCWPDDITFTMGPGLSFSAWDQARYQLSDQGPLNWCYGSDNHFFDASDFSYPAPNQVTISGPLVDGWGKLDKEWDVEQRLWLFFERDCSLDNVDSWVDIDFDMIINDYATDPADEQIWDNGVQLSHLNTSVYPGLTTGSNNYGFSLAVPNTSINTTQNTTHFVTDLIFSSTGGGSNCIDNVFIYAESNDVVIQSLTDENGNVLTPVNGIYQLGTVCENNPETLDFLLSYDCVTNPDGSIQPISIEFFYNNDCSGYPTLADLNAGAETCIATESIVIDIIPEGSSYGISVDPISAVLNDQCDPITYDIVITPTDVGYIYDLLLSMEAIGNANFVSGEFSYGTLVNQPIIPSSIVGELFTFDLGNDVFGGSNFNNGMPGIDVGPPYVIEPLYLSLTYDGSCGSPLLMGFNTNTSANNNCGDPIVVPIQVQSNITYINPFGPTPPVFSGVPSDVVLTLFDPVPGPAQVTAEDVCGNPVNVDVSSSQAQTTCPYSHHYIYTWTATDECGNMASVSQNIYITDPECDCSFTEYSYSLGPCDPETNTYILNLILYYEGAPSTGTIDVMGTSYPITGSPQSFNIPLVANGQAVDVFASFSDNSDCSFDKPELFFSPEPCGPECYFKDIEIEVKDCDPETGYYEVVLIIEYENPPSTGDLVVNGQNFPISGSPQTVVLQLYSDGMPVDFSAYFTANPHCEKFIEALWIAPEPCAAECIFEDYSFEIGHCDENTGNYQASITLYYAGAPPNGDLIVNGQTFPITGSPQTVVLDLPADGLPVDLYAYFSDNPECFLDKEELWIAPEPCIDCFFKDVNYEYSPCDPNTGLYTVAIILEYENPPGTGDLIVNGVAYTVTGSPQTIILTLPADGLPFALMAYFEDDEDCRINIDELFIAPEPCGCNIENVDLNVTACDDATGTYDLTVVVTYDGAPNTGSLFINGQSFPITGSPQTQVITLVADGLTHDLDVYFSNNPFCTYFLADAWTSPQPCTDECGITDATAEVGSCDETTGLYPVDVTVTYSNPPNTGVLVVNGVNFTITGSPQTITLNLPSNGAQVNFYAAFSDDPNCFLFIPNLWTAPDNCFDECIFDDYSVQVGPCDPNTNTYDAVVTLYFSGGPNSGDIIINGDPYPVTASPMSVVLTLPADGMDVSLSAWFTDDPDCCLHVLDLWTAPDPCEPECGIKEVTFELGECDPESNTYSADLTITYDYPPLTGDIVVNGVSFPISGSPQTVTLLLPADGSGVNLYIYFSDDPNCDFFEPNYWIAPEPCSPPECNIHHVAFDIGDCDPSTNSYQVSITFDYYDQPATGSVVILGQSFPITGGPQTVTLTLPADGLQVDLFIYFSDDESCQYYLSNAWTAPVCPDCSIHHVSYDLGPCDPSTGLYPVYINFNYDNAPSSGNVIVNGQSFAITGSPQSVVLYLVGDGQPVDLNIYFTNDPECQYYIPNFWVAPQCETECDIHHISYDLKDCDPVTNTYGAYVTFHYNGAPTTGNVIVYGQSFPITGSPQTVYLNGLPANGLPVDLTIYFTDNPNCQIVLNNFWQAPEPCGDPVECYFTDYEFQVGECNPETGLYSVYITLYYVGAPLTGDLIVNGQAFPITGSPQTVLLYLPADGMAVDLFAYFSADPDCRIFKDDLWQAPEPCGEPCFIEGVDIKKIKDCDPETGLFTVSFVVYYSGVNTGDIIINGQAFPVTGSPQSINLSMPATGLWVDLDISFTDNAACPFHLDNWIQSPEPCGEPVHCSFEDYELLGIHECDQNGNFQLTLMLWYSGAPATGNLVVNGQSFPITGSPQIVNLTLPGNGSYVDLNAHFSDLPSCRVQKDKIMKAPECPQPDDGGDESSQKSATFNANPNAEVLVYPNPSFGKNLEIEINTLSPNLEHTMSIVTVDSYGKLVDKSELRFEGRNLRHTLAFDPQLVPGLYWVIIEVDGVKTNAKIVVQ